MKKPVAPPFPGMKAPKVEIDAWVLGRVVEAERWLRSLHPWHRAWLEWKWFRLDPMICKIQCWLKGETCPWE